MSAEAIFWPILVQVSLTFFIYGLAYLRRDSAVITGTAKPADFRIPTIEPETSATAIRSLSNQFELPVLFYVCCLTLFVLGAVSPMVLGLSWAFVLSRIGHAYVHVTTNKLRYRRPLFMIGFFIMAALWLVVLIRLISAR